jgi:hypothetical protein
MKTQKRRMQLQSTLDLSRDGELQEGRRIMRLCAQRAERKHGSRHHSTILRVNDLANWEEGRGKSAS